MGAKVTFNSTTKIIEVHQAPTGSPPLLNLNVRTDIYSDGKEDWLADPVLNKFLFPVTAIGGDPLPGNIKLGTTFFLEYGWKILPYNSDHTFAVEGNLFSRDGSDPYLSTTDPHTVKVISFVSNLVEQITTNIGGNTADIAAAVWAEPSTVIDSGSPTNYKSYGQLMVDNAGNFDLLAALQISVDDVPQDVWDVDSSVVVAGSFGEIARRVAFNGVVYVDPGGTAGTTYPTGTLGQPSSNIADATSIATAEDINTLILLEDVTALATDNLNGYNVEGLNAARAVLTLTAGVKTNKTQFRNVNLQGTLGGVSIVRESVLNGVSNFSGIAFNCLLNPGTLTLDTTPPQPAFFLSCYSGSSPGAPIIDMGGGLVDLIVRDYSGNLEIENASDAGAFACLDFTSGHLILDSTVSAGNIIVRGVYGITDNSTGATVTRQTNLDSIESKVDLVQLDVTDIVATTLTILKYHANRTLIDETAYTLTVFDDDKVTPIAIFDLKDEVGTASITSIFERIPTGSP